MVGFIDCTTTPSISDAYQEFAATVGKYTQVLDIRCFAVEPADNQPDTDSRVVMIPNQSQQKLAFYLSTMISDYASTVLKELATQVAPLAAGTTGSGGARLTAVANQVAPLQPECERTATQVGYLEDRSDARSVNGDAPATSIFDRTVLRVKKNSPARSLKYIADICLLGGSTSDAQQ